ncbi:MAG TPA: amidohydrolase family protein [Terriglobales bacterium]|nr:amidohydrolase family protein [Terriglobales bacterium]
MNRCLAGLLAFSLCSLAQQPAKTATEPAKLIAITNVDIVDVEAGSTVPNQTVLIADGKILLVGNPLNTAIPKDALRISGRDKYLMPGLWDMHVHVAGVTARPEWGKQLLPVYLAYGITGVRDMGGDLQALKEWRRAASVIPGPEMIVAGPFVDASADGYASPKEVIAVKTPLEARAAVRKIKADGANFIKIGSRLTRELYFAIADETGKMNMAFLGHVPDSVPVDEASFSGMGSMEHLFGVMLACSSKSAELRQRLKDAKDRSERAKIADEVEATFSETVAMELFSHFAERNTYQVPTLVWTRNTSTLDKASSNDPGLQYIPEALRKEWTPANADKFVSAAGRAYYQRKLKQDLKLISLMNKAGVPLMAGSDSLDPFVFPGDSLHSELELLVSAGLTPGQALRTATLNAARFMGRERTLGEVKGGKAADLVLLDADPLKDIRNTRKISAVFSKGRHYSRADLDKLLHDAAVSFGSSPTTPSPASTTK